MSKAHRSGDAANPGEHFNGGQDSQRPPPEEFLEHIERSKKGRLKIYIGHAAGTGKTVQLLREANDLLSRGKNIIGAYIETHGRKGTQAATGNLRILPRKRVEYKGTTIEEMDIDAVLTTAPEIAIVDELAHTNAPGSRNKHRWQDVEELLDAGISVITAVNIQHIESLNPVVERITGIRVQETVPDSFFQNADQIVNIDITSSDLRERMRRGEIYAAEKIERALTYFFTSRNLNSLRELALREVVRFLDQTRHRAVSTENESVANSALMARIYEEQNFNGPEAMLTSPVAESVVDPVVMVASSSRPPDIRNLLRKAAAIAYRLNTHWYLVYVETPRESATNIDATTQRILLGNITLAKDLGATVVRLRGRSVAKTLADFAKEYGVTHAIFGTSPAAKPWQFAKRLFSKSVSARFHELAPEIDLHISGYPLIESNTA